MSARARARANGAGAWGPRKRARQGVPGDAEAAGERARASPRERRGAWGPRKTRGGPGDAEAAGERARASARERRRGRGPQFAGRTSCGRSDGSDRWSRRIRRRRHTAAHRGAAASRASAGGRPRHQGVAVRRRGPFFLNVTPSRSISSQSELSAAVVGRASRSSANVASGRARMRARSRSSLPAKTRDRNFVGFRGAIDPVSRRRCAKRWTDARLTAKVAATASASPLVSQA